MLVSGAYQVDVRSLPTDFWGIIGPLGEGLAGFAAILGLIYVVKTLRQSRSDAQARENEARRARTAVVHAHWADRDFRRLLSPVTAFLDARHVKQCLVQIDGWRTARHAESAVLPRVPADLVSPRACKNDVVHVLSLYEDICQRYNLGELDRLSVATSLGLLLAQQFRMASWFIYWQRATRSDLLYSEWQEAARDLCNDTDLQPRLPLHGKVLERLRGFDGTPPIRVLCVPPLGGAFDHELARTLSCALAMESALGTDEERDALRRGICESAVQDSQWNVVLLPPSLLGPTGNAGALHTLAIGIARRLQGLTADQISAIATKLMNGESFAAATRTYPVASGWTR